MLDFDSPKAENFDAGSTLQDFLNLESTEETTLTRQEQKQPLPLAVNQLGDFGVSGEKPPERPRKRKSGPRDDEHNDMENARKKKKV